MNISDIIYYRRENGKSKTLSLRDLCLRDEFYLEDVFYAVKDAIDEEDLLGRLCRIIWDPIELEKITPENIRFLVTDTYGNTNYLKMKRKKEK